MIPRTKVNYRLSDLLSALFILEGHSDHRKALCQQLEAFLGVPNVLLTASGRGALYIILKCLPQRQILIPAYTCKAVVEAALLAGKEILYAELGPNSFNMSCESVRGLLNTETILLATHQFGIPCDIRPIVSCAREAGAYVIEDAAASLGSRVAGQLTGTFGDAAFFSFDSTKLLNVPLKGGALHVRDAEMLARCVAFRNDSTRKMPLVRKLKYLALGAALVTLEHPLAYRMFHSVKFHWRGRYTDDSAEFKPGIGPYYLDRLSEWQAAILLPQTKMLDRIIFRRQRLYREYRRRLQGINSFALPPEDLYREWAPIRFPICVAGDKLGFYKRAVQLGVDFAFSFSFLASPRDFVRSHQLASSVLDLPFYDRLTDAELEDVVAVLRHIDGEISAED